MLAIIIMDLEQQVHMILLITVVVQELDIVIMDLMEEFHMIVIMDLMEEFHMIKMVLK